jgi:hypothetical protein
MKWDAGAIRTWLELCFWVATKACWTALVVVFTVRCLTGEGEISVDALVRLVTSG